MRTFNKNKWGLFTAACLMAVLLVLVSPVGVQIGSLSEDLGTPALEIGQHQLTLIVGTEAYAAGTADYTCDGTDDDVQFQQALNALPAGGGKLVVLTGDYSFSATVSRAIDNVTIEGMGDSTYLAYNGSTALFDAGSQSGWVFRNFRTDTGGVDVDSTTDYVITNVTVGTTVVGKITRGATFVVAASNSTASSKAQADYVCDGTADEVEVQAAIDALMSSVTDEAVSIGSYAVFDDMDDPVSGGGPYTWVGEQGDETLSQDTGDKHEGTASLKIIGGATNDPGAKLTGLASLDWSGYDMLEVWVKMPDFYTHLELKLIDSSANYVRFHERHSDLDSWDRLDTTSANVASIIFNFDEETNHSGTFDWTDVTEIHIFAMVPTDGYTFRLDYIGLNSWDTLANPWLQPGQTVTDNGTTYTKYTDYEMDYRNSRIKAVIGGAIGSGATVYVDYQYGTGMVNLLEGEYHTNAAIRIKSWTSLVGVGKVRILNDNATQYWQITNYDWDDTNLLQDGNCDIVIKNLFVDGQFTTPGTTGQAGVFWFAGVVGLYIDNIEAINGYTHVFETSECKDVWVYNSRFSQARGDDNVSIVDMVATPRPYGLRTVHVSRNINFINCISERSMSPDHTGSAFEVQDGVQDISFINCVVRDNPGVGFAIGPHANCFPVRHVRFINCSVINNGMAGFSVVGNAASYDGTPMVEDILIDGCRIEGLAVSTASTAIGLHIRSACNVRVINTTLEKSWMLIEHQAADPNECEDIKVINCHLDGHDLGYGATVLPGIRIFTAKKVDIIGNYIANCPGGGIDARAMYDVLEDLHIERNTIINCSTGILLYAYSGFKLERAWVRENSVKGCTSGISGSGTDFEDIFIERNDFSGNTWPIDPTAFLGLAQYYTMYEGHCDYFMDIQAASADYVRNDEDLSAGLAITFTIDNQPDVPRTITWVLTHANITEFNLRIKGTTPEGFNLTETFTEASGWSGETVHAFAYIDWIRLYSRTGTGVGDTCDIGISSKLGLGNTIVGTTSVYKVTKNGADYSGAGNITVDSDFNLVDVSTGGAIITNDDFTIYYGDNSNIVS